MFFAFADLIIHSIFDTNSRDWTINDASSYLDLSIIYGHNEEQVDSIRKKDGTGHIWEDAFADKRLLFMPPSVGALAVLFSRHHNVRLRSTAHKDVLTPQTVCCEQDPKPQRTRDIRMSNDSSRSATYRPVRRDLSPCSTGQHSVLHANYFNGLRWRHSWSRQRWTDLAIRSTSGPELIIILIIHFDFHPGISRANT